MSVHRASTATFGRRMRAGRLSALTALWLSRRLFRMFVAGYGAGRAGSRARRG